jgi:DNA-binding MarR family transcriptional regulator
MYNDNIVVIFGFMNMNTKAKKLYSVIRDIRLSFNLMRAWADQMHQDLGVNASMRAVMESVAGGDERSVPDIARSRGVSRQHIQVIVNSLTKANLIKTRNNPDDKRTFLVSLTNHGEIVFSEIQNREAVELKRLSKVFSTDELNVTQSALRNLINVLKGDENE